MKKSALNTKMSSEYVIVILSFRLSNIPNFFFITQTFYFRNYLYT